METRQPSTGAGGTDVASVELLSTERSGQRENRARFAPQSFTVNDTVPTSIRMRKFVDAMQRAWPPVDPGAYKAEVVSPYREATLDEKLHADVVSLTFTDLAEMDYLLTDLVDRANTDGILIEGSAGEIAEGT